MECPSAADAEAGHLGEALLGPLFLFQFHKLEVQLGELVDSVEVLHLYVVEIGGFSLHLADARLPGPDCYEYISDDTRLAGLQLRALLLDDSHDLLDVLEGLVDIFHNFKFLVSGDGPGYFLNDAHVLEFGDELTGIKEEGVGVVGGEGVGHFAVEKATTHHHVLL